MQTTLLGLAIAVILALVTALVGPLFVDWGRYRATFEAEASRLVGSPVRVRGAIAARALPIPSLALEGVEVGPGEEPNLRVRSLVLEFALGPLLRGEWRASQVRAEAPQLSLGLDAAGRVAAPALAIGLDPDQFSIEQLTVENGRASFTDAASGFKFVLESLSFSGELRSLLGPFKGDGAFIASGQLYGYRIAGGRRGPDGAIKLRLGVDPAERRPAIETEGRFWFEKGNPRYEGALTVTRPAGVALASGKTAVNEPWRVSSHVNANAREALLEQFEFQYGPEDRAIRLAGTADVKFGRNPRFEGVLSARQIDVDRLLGPSDGARRLPLAAFQAFVARFMQGVGLPIPLKIGIDIDALTIGGAALQSVRGDLQARADDWNIDTLEFRAPGLTQARLSGRFRPAGKSIGFSGPVSVEAGDPRALLAWLEGKSDTLSIPPGHLRARGDVTIGGERVAIEQLKAEFDRKPFDGRLAYVFATERRPARVEAALNAAELDVDAALAFANAALSGTSFERPGEIALALAIGRARYAGIEGSKAEADLKFDASGLAIERLAISDVRGASLNASGRIDDFSSSPRGAVSVALEAARLDGVAALAAKFWPETVESLRGYFGHLAPAKVTAKLEVEPVPAAPVNSAGRFQLEGKLGLVRVNIVGGGVGATGKIAAANVRADGNIESDDGAALAALLGLDRFFSIDKRPATLSVVAEGPVDGDLRTDARFAAGGLWGSAAGAMRLAQGELAGTLDAAISAADLRILRREAAPVPASLKMKVGVAGRSLTLEEVSGTVAGSGIAGRLALTPGRPTQIDGRIQADYVNAAAALATALGAAAHPAERAARWASEPFNAGRVSGLQGRIDFHMATAALRPGLLVRDLRGSARFDGSAMALENIEGTLGDGRFTAGAGFRESPAGLWARARVALLNGDLAALIRGDGRPPISGRLSLEAEAEGAGLSPAALIGSLQGTGALSAENVQISGLDPKAIDAAIRASERGLAPERIPAFVSAALDAGRLHLAAATGALAIADGRARLVDVKARAEAADIAASAALDLIEETLDLRVAMTAGPRSEPPSDQRPQISVMLKGPVNAPRRTLDAAPLVNWVTLRAVEREAKRLEAAEREAKRLAEIEAALRAEQAERERAERERAERERAERERAERERAERERAERERAHTSPQPMTSGAVALPNRAPDLPPPIDIRPLPAGPKPSRPAPPSRTGSPEQQHAQ